ncbi:hypothetical protein HZC07_00710, partial [Candidatus Micrarchaeota archaeon]|nr:hypothetical protein [Candidatus Micrarchaeota archaeon]
MVYSFYLNGEYVGGSSGTLVIPDAATPLFIGAAEGSPTNQFDGLIDAVRLYNRSLSVAEIQQQYFSNLYKYDTDKWQFYTNESNLTDGTYTYFACANDSVENQNCTGVKTFTVDTTAPATTLNAPEPDLNTSSGNIEFNFTSLDNVSTTLSCDLFIDDILNTTNSSVSNATLTSFDVSGIPEGQHNWTVGCNDSVGNLANATNSPRNFTIDLTSPVVSLISPANATSTTNTSLNFTFNVTDDLSPILNCSLYINDTLNQTNESVLNDTNTLFSVSGFAVGS